MNTINIQIAKVESTMLIDNRGVFKRLAKLLEEQGELYEAYLSNNEYLILEESVDNLIVLVSLAYEINKDSLFQIGHVINKGFTHQLTIPDLVTIEYKSNLLMKYSVAIGHMSDSIQKHEQIISSRYKGNISPEETLETVRHATFSLMQFVSTISTENTLINELIIRKVSKWHEKVS